jgi:ubiquinone/menaquinone biosynthesis C-methylase UbiE
MVEARVEGSEAAKAAALREFEKWALTYDRSILQTLLFRPTFDVLLEEVMRWRVGVAGGLERPFDVLDVGCGTGVWAAILRGSRLPVTVTGLDYSPEMCRRAAAKAAVVGADDMHFVNGDSEHLPFPDASFDLITCTHSFHHYPDQAAVVRGMARVLRPGGRLMLCDGYKNNVIGWFVFDVCVTRVEGDVYHVGWQEMRALFEQAGFGDVRQRKFNIWAPAMLTIGVRPD